jgi:hypothetical protein
MTSLTLYNAKELIQGGFAIFSNCEAFGSEGKGSQAGPNTRPARDFASERLNAAPNMIAKPLSLAYHLPRWYAKVSRMSWN